MGAPLHRVPGKTGPGPSLASTETRRRVFPFSPERPSRSASLLQEFTHSLFAVLFPASCALCGRELAELRG